VYWLVTMSLRPTTRMAEPLGFGQIRLTSAAGPLQPAYDR